jgi:hypothetical protein
MSQPLYEIVFAGSVTGFTDEGGLLHLEVGVDFDSASVLLPQAVHDQDYNSYRPLQFTGEKRFTNLSGTLLVRSQLGSAQLAPKGIGVTAMVTAVKKKS